MTTLVTIYWLCFGVGLVYVLVVGSMGLISAGLEGAGADHDFALDHDADFDLGHDADFGIDHDVGFDVDADADAGFDIDFDMASDADMGADAAAETGTEAGEGDGHGHELAINEGLASYSPLSPVSIMSALAAFGAGGLISTATGISKWLGLAIAGGTGILMSYLFYLVIGKFLFSMQGSSEAKQYDMIGLEAEVITPMEEDLSGEIAYVLEGVRYTAPARLVKEGHADRRDKVRIRGIKKNIVYVEQKKKLLS